MDTFKVEIDRKQISEIINKTVQGEITEQLRSQLTDINRSIEEYFKKSFFNDTRNQFESALDWTVENAFREGLDLAMKELNFKELIAKKAAEILNSDNFIKELAEAKVRSSLGLLQKEN